MERLAVKGPKKQIHGNASHTAENNALTQVRSGKLTPADGLKQAKDQVSAVLAKQT